ncbi:MAG: lactate utilization protein [Planctomycetales bacterium]|nr:lactate utilization protein [Planctomycetales bacterium]
MTTTDLAAAARAAVAEPALGARVHRATAHAIEGRLRLAAEDPRWEALRERARALKRHALANLDRYLQEFARNAGKAGVAVSVARDAAEARRIVVRLARDAGARVILKGKSMTAEEVGLNEALEAAGFRPLETDLGEFIVQIAGEPPSHITAPAIHRDAASIAGLFLEKGVIAELPPALRPGGAAGRAEVEAAARELSLAARRFLRRDLLGAAMGHTMGVTGANFLVAETGTVVLVENEGNIRFTTTTPDVHVVLAGIEKVIPRMADLGVFLSLLAPSSTGQRQSAYVSLLGRPFGKRRHVVLLDNGRVETLRLGEESDVLSCIRCGACLNVCPVYRNVSGHAYGGAYPGPIGKVILPHLGADGRARHGALPFFSTLCGACADACPVRIPIPERLLGWRARLHAEGRTGWRRRLGMRLFAAAARRPWAFRVGGWAWRRLPWLARLAPPLRRWLRGRDLPS